jgi:hypothetical protein
MHRILDCRGAMAWADLCLAECSQEHFAATTMSGGTQHSTQRSERFWAMNLIHDAGFALWLEGPGII